MQNSDELLLKSFAARRDEEAFRSLVNRYLGLIFQTSLRRTGSRQVAEEVSQNVLCALAKKAGMLSRHPERLAAWLHRATLFESSKAMRSESSYQRRKALHRPDEIIATGPGESESWTEALPHLDTALDQLSESERQVLLLHYFEQFTFPRIACRLGKSTEAVKKQSQRAIEKLARILHARGITLSIPAVVSGLTGEFAKAAPLPLIQTAAVTAFAGQSTHSTTALSLMFASKSKLVVPLAILLCAIPIALQQLAISTAATRFHSLQEQLASAGNPMTESMVGLTVGSIPRIHGLSTSTDIMVLVDEYDEARRSEGPAISSQNIQIMRFKEKLAAVDTDDLVRLIGECAGLRIRFSKKSQTFHVLIEELGARDPGMAVRVGTSALENEPRLIPAIGRIGRLLASWAKSDQEASWQWLQQQQGKTILGRPGSRGNRLINSLQAPFAASLISMQSPMLADFFGGLQDLDRAAVINLLVSMDFVDGGPDAAAQAAWTSSCIKVINESAPAADRQKLLASLISGPNCTHLVRDLNALRKLLTNPDIGPEELQPLLRTLTPKLLSQSRTNPAIDAKQAELRDWLEAVLPGSGSSMMDEVLDQNAIRELEALQKSRNRTDDQLFRALTSPTASFKLHLPAALELAGRIKDPVKRATAIEHISKQ